MLRIALLVGFGQAPGPELKLLRIVLLGARSAQAPSPQCIFRAPQMLCKCFLHAVEKTDPTVSMGNYSESCYWGQFWSGFELKLLRIAFLVCFGQAPGPELKLPRIAFLGAAMLKFPARNVFSCSPMLCKCFLHAVEKADPTVSMGNC